MKRFFPIIIATIMLMSLCSCGTNEMIPDVPKIDTEQTEDDVLTKEEISELFNMEHITYGGSQLSYYRDVVTDVIFIRYEDSSGYAGQGGLTWLPTLKQAYL